MGNKFVLFFKLICLFEVMKLKYFGGVIGLVFVTRFVVALYVSIFVYVLNMLGCDLMVLFMYCIGDIYMMLFDDV